MSRPLLPILPLLLLLTACEDPFFAPEVEAAGEPGAAVYSASGSFTKIGYAAKGKAFYQIDANGSAALFLSSDFSIPDVPAVSIFLSNTEDLSTAVKVGALKSSSGGQKWTFKVPLGAVWRFALLWSEELDVGVARATLQPGG